MTTYYKNIKFSSQYFKYFAIFDVQYLNHTDSFLSEQDDLISSYKNTKCLPNKKLQQKDTQIAVQTRRI